MDTLTTVLWDEWGTFVPNTAADAAREIVALFVGMGWEGGPEGGAVLRSRRMGVFQRLRRLWPFVAEEWGVDLGRVILFPSKGGSRKPSILMTLQLLVRSRELLTECIESHRMSWPWVRGLWGAAGALYLPKNGYFLVLRLSRQNPLLPEVKAFLEDEGCLWSKRLHEGKEELLLRHQQYISIFLSRMGLCGTSLRLEEHALFRSMRDQANRLVNCDSANIKKSLLAAERQLEECRQVVASGLMETLPGELQELVRVRLEHGSASLQELGQLVQKPVSKSTVEYRWGKLRRLVGDLLQQRKEGRSCTWENPK